MSWFKADDKLHSHMKTMTAGTHAMGLWILCGSWAADQMSDGFVPEGIAVRFDPKAKQLAGRLVSAGLWSTAERDGLKGWQFHEWHEYQPTRAETEAKRQQEREKKRNQRRGKSGQFEESPPPPPEDVP